MAKLLLKLLLNGAAVIPTLLWFTGISAWTAILMSLLLSLISYVAGDQLILRYTTNALAIMADVVLAFVFLWSAGKALAWPLSFGELIAIVAIFNVVEILMHFLFKERPAHAEEK